eukprot:2855048-Prymnesium_polylepis.1
MRGAREAAAPQTPRPSSAPSSQAIAMCSATESFCDWKLSHEHADHVVSSYCRLLSLLPTIVKAAKGLEDEHKHLMPKPERLRAVAVARRHIPAP